MIKFSIGYLIFSALTIGWMIQEIKHTPVSPDDGTGDVDYDGFVKDMNRSEDEWDEVDDMIHKW